MKVATIGHRLKAKTQALRGRDRRRGHGLTPAVEDVEHDVGAARAPPLPAKTGGARTGSSGASGRWKACPAPPICSAPEARTGPANVTPVLFAEFSREVVDGDHPSQHRQDLGNREFVPFLLFAGAPVLEHGHPKAGVVAVSGAGFHHHVRGHTAQDDLANAPVQQPGQKTGIEERIDALLGEYQFVWPRCDDFGELAPPSAKNRALDTNSPTSPPDNDPCQFGFCTTSVSMGPSLRKHACG